MKKYCMDIKSKNIQIAIYSIILLVIISCIKYNMYIINTPYFDKVKEKIFSVLLIASALSYIFTVIIWLPLRYKKTAYYVNDDVIYIQKGVFLYPTSI